MHLRDTIICFVCIILMVSLLIAAGMQLDFINSQRQEMKLIINEPLANAPPSLAFATVAMGAFRGLVVDVLWLRADRLKEQGQFFDAKQLAEWISILQPRFASVWEFHAWNMAYNISVTIPETQPEQRWHWVKNGYELLRDQGIPLNPKSILLYRELARIFQHKIGGITDDAHKYYKIQLALAMEPLLSSQDNQLDSTDNQYFKALAEAPVDLKQIIKDSDVAELISALKSADKSFEDDDEFVSNYLSLRQNPGRFNPNAFEIINSFRGTAALKKFDIFAKAYQLRKIWKLDPVLMCQLHEIHGPVDWNDPNEHLPLDWRHPQTHAIYWAVKGLQKAGKKAEVTAGEGQYSADERNTDRIVAHSLQSLVRSGKISLYKTPRQARESVPVGMSNEPQTSIYTLFLWPDVKMFEPYNRAIMKIIEKYTDPSEDDMNSYQIGHRNMLKAVVVWFYQAGQKQQAQKVYDQLKQLYPADDYKVPLVSFIRNQLREQLRLIDITGARGNIQALLEQSYGRYALRDDDEASGLEKMAEEVYEHYKSAGFNEGRLSLPEFKRLRYLALIDFLQDRRYPAELRRSLLGRIEIERPKLFEQLMQQEEEMLKQLEQSQ